MPIFSRSQFNSQVMKNLVMFMLIFVFTLEVSLSQNIGLDAVPPKVLESFKKKFTNVNKQSWELDEGNYGVIFKQKDQIRTAVFDPNGNWLETGLRIKNEEIPKKTMTLIRQNYGGYSVDKAYSVETSSGETYYEVLLEHAEIEMEVRIYPSGKIMVVNDDEDEDGDVEEDPGDE